MTIKVDHYLTHSQIKDIISVTYDPNMELILMLMFYCGLRVSEAINIHNHTINKEKGYPTITLTGKGSKERTIRIPNKTLVSKLKFRKTKFPYTRQGVRQHIVRKSNIRFVNHGRDGMLEKYFLQDHHTLLHIIVSKRVDTLVLMFKEAKKEEQLDEWLRIKRTFYYE